MFKRLFPLVILIACLAPRIGLGGLIGEPAPPLAVKDWVKGGPVQVKAGTNIFVVEIWQTSIPTSRASVTNFNQVQNHFKTNGVVVVGICDEPVEDLKKFVQQDCTNIEFAVAADDQRKTSFSYMSPISQRGVPYAFIVGTNGIVLWHGWSMQGLYETMDQILAGRFDVEQEKKYEIARHQMRQYIGLVQHGDARAPAAGRTLLAIRTNNVELLCSMALEIITAPQLPKRDFGLANQALRQAEKLQTTNNCNQVKFARAVYLFETGHHDEGLLQATQALALATSPLDKAVIESGLHTMESRWATLKELQSKTNRMNGAHSPGRATAVETNRVGVTQDGQPAQQ
jgi:peroxiredoxin